MNILLTGSVAYDYLMTFPGYFKDHILPERLNAISLSFLVETMVRLRGGIAPNIAYTLALLGQRPRLWAAVGEDFEEYRSWLEEKGVETSGARVIPGVFTASFFVNTDRANAQIASFYPGAMAYASQLSLYQLSDNIPDLVVISPNDPQAMIQYVEECQGLKLPYIYDPSQQIVRLSGENLQAGIRQAYGLFVNDYEAALIEKMTGWDIQIILEINPQITVVITRGEYGADIYTSQGNLMVPVVSPLEIVDPTGVGDAFRGGFLTGLSHGFDLALCGRMGALAATYCLEKRGPQGHFFTREEFLARYRSLYADGDLLNILNSDTIQADQLGNN
ncbi:MAG TPA: carbohydrate kinase family protein [Anaerolineales bacterium]|nr:carbohydrate kinase family protein [Anaerolineales bacterium]